MSKELIDELRDTFDYHEGGYLIRKKNGKPCGMRATCKGYATVRVARIRANIAKLDKMIREAA